MMKRDRQQQNKSEWNSVSLVLAAAMPSIQRAHPPLNTFAYMHTFDADAQLQALGLLIVLLPEFVYLFLV